MALVQNTHGVRFLRHHQPHRHAVRVDLAQLRQDDVRVLAALTLALLPVLADAVDTVAAQRMNVPQ